MDKRKREAKKQQKDLIKHRKRLDKKTIDQKEIDPDLDEDLRPSQWTNVQYEKFFVALKEHGLNFSKIADAIGSNRFIVSTFFKKYSERKNLPCNPLNQPIWTD